MGDRRIGMASASFQQGAGHAWSEITHAQDTRRAAADSGRHVKPQDRVEPVDRRDDGHGLLLQRARSAEMCWPLPEDLTDEALEARLFPASTALAEIKARRPQPDWRTIHRELRRKGVTLQLLWEEHRAAHPNGYGYSRFCDLYRAWEARLSPTMRQTHVAGERLFVDYAGTTLEVIDGLTGEVITAQLFVAALGASSYTYAEATWTQGLADWIGSHTRAFAFVGGVTAMVVSDNLKSGITKACFYEPAVNRSYAEMAAHYDTAIVPARPKKPRDKAKVEVAVLLATRWIIAKLTEPPVLLADRSERRDP